MGMAAPRSPVVVQDPLKSLVMGPGPSLSVNCYLENKFHAVVLNSVVQISGFVTIRV